MTKITLIGIDPGLIDTGVSCVTLDPDSKTWSMRALAITAVGDETDDRIINTTQQVKNCVLALSDGDTHIWVEKWRERGTVFGENPTMRAIERELRVAIPYAKFLENMGVKKLISNKLLNLFDLLKVQSTNHRDIQAAARIMLLGAIKDEALNPVVYAFVTDALDGMPWKKAEQAVAA